MLCSMSHEIIDPTQETTTKSQRQRDEYVGLSGELEMLQKEHQVNPHRSKREKPPTRWGRQRGRCIGRTKPKRKPESKRGHA